MTIRRLIKAIDWVQKEPEILKYVDILVEENIKLKREIKKLENQDIFELFPSVKGKRYKDIIVPDWFQYEDKNKLAEDVLKYVIKDLLPTRIVR